MPDKPQANIPPEVQAQLDGVAASLRSVQAQVEILMLAFRTASEALQTVAALRPEEYLSQREGQAGPKAN